MIISSAAKEIIDQVIINDEGGWKLTENENDPDGGWTFAGVTSKTWNSIDYLGQMATYHDMAHYVASDLDAIKEEIYEVYYKEYFLKVIGNVSVVSAQAAILSCAVNCGVEVAKRLWEIDSTYSYDRFIINWHYHYIDLVKKNAEAWKSYADYLSSCIRNNSVPVTDGPATLRAENLKGWFNRVERYRSL